MSGFASEPIIVRRALANDILRAGDLDEVDRLFLFRSRGAAMSLVKKRILIVEDEPAIRATLRARLEANQYEVLCTKDGEEGLSLARQEEPDLIILDVILPKWNGYTICAILKGDEHYRHIPILMLTERATSINRKHGRKVGADAYITKPFDSAVLMQAVRRLLHEN